MTCFIVFDGVSVKSVKDHKHLGLTLSSNMKWDKHIETIFKSASKVISIMRKLKYNFTRIALNQIALDQIYFVRQTTFRIFMYCLRWLHY